MSQPAGFYVAPPSDRELDADTVRVVVRDQFPRLAVQSVEYFGSGWEHDAYLVDHHIVFRFPRYADVGYGFEREQRVLSLVASAVGDSVGIPTITLWGEPSARFPHPFAGHELIPGIAVDDPSVPWPLELADDLAHALTRIHAIPLAAVEADVIAVALNYRESLDEVQRWVRQVPEIDDLAPDAVAWLAVGPAVPPEYDGPPRFIHGDFQPDHIIVNRTTGRLSGIIDWGGVLGDPAQDLNYLLLCRGWSFFQRVVNAYGLPLDAGIIERTLFRARLGALSWLADAIKRRASPTVAVEIVRRAFATG